MTSRIRPSFDEYFMMMAFCVSARSDDQFIQHGAVIVDRDTHYIIGTGYNGTIRGLDETKVDLSNRDLRRAWMIHAEENAILNCAKHPSSLKNGAIIYITGKPCVNCLQRLINFGISEIVMVDRLGSITENDETEAMRQKLIKMSRCTMRSIEVNGDIVKDLVGKLVWDLGNGKK